jgi:hypothetical protein
MKNFRVLFVLAALFAMACSGGGKGPGDVFKDTMMKLADGKYDAVIAVMANDDGQGVSDDEKEKTMAMLGMANAQIVSKKGISKINILSEEISEDGLSAKITYEMVFGDDDTATEEAIMLKVEGKWKMKKF